MVTTKFVVSVIKGVAQLEAAKHVWPEGHALLAPSPQGILHETMASVQVAPQ
jgi:hypothetical protein